MSCCCKKIKNLGCFPGCDVDIVTGMVAQATGDYVIRLDYLRTTRSLTVIFADTDDLNISFLGLNTDYQYTFQILDPSGNELTDADGNDCFTFKTVADYIYES